MNYKIKLLFTAMLISGCTGSTFSGYVNDFDTNKPVRNVTVSINTNTVQTDSTGYFSIPANSNLSCIITLEKEGYANKKVFRKPDLEKNNVKKIKKNTIYMFKNESDFANK